MKNYGSILTRVVRIGSWPAGAMLGYDGSKRTIEFGVFHETPTCLLHLINFRQNRNFVIPCSPSNKIQCQLYVICIVWLLNIWFLPLIVLVLTPFCVECGLKRARRCLKSKQCNHHLRYVPKNVLYTFLILDVVPIWRSLPYVYNAPWICISMNRHASRRHGAVS